MLRNILDALMFLNIIGIWREYLYTYNCIEVRCKIVYLYKILQSPIFSVLIFKVYKKRASRTIIKYKNLDIIYLRVFGCTSTSYITSAWLGSTFRSQNNKIHNITHINRYNTKICDLRYYWDTYKKHNKIWCKSVCVIQNVWCDSIVLLYECNSIICKSEYQYNALIVLKSSKAILFSNIGLTKQHIDRRMFHIVW